MSESKFYRDSMYGDSADPTGRIIEDLSQVQGDLAELKRNGNGTIDAQARADIATANNNINIYGRKAVYVESYDSLKVLLGDGTYDYAPCIQKAHDVAAGSSLAVIYPSGRVLQVGTPIRLKNNNGNYIFGNRCVLKRVGLTATSDTPIMYYMGLTDIGGTTKSYSYNSGVFIYDMKFMGTGYGVGYKHAIAGELYLNNCMFDSTLEVGVVLSGTNGVHFYNCQIAGSKKGIFCARVAEDSYTVGYTSEGAGWNDGIYMVGGMITCSTDGYGFYYSGTTSEGVIKFQNIKLIGNTRATGIYGKSFTNMIVDGGWSEYFNGGRVIWADSDASAGGYEPNLLVVRNWQFTHTASGGKADYSVSSKAVRTLIEDCHFLNNPWQQHILYQSGSLSSLRINTTAQPTAVDTTNGTITLPKTNISDTRDIIVTDGTNSYYCVFNADMGASGYKYNTYTYTTPMKRAKWWVWGTYTDAYYTTRILTPTLSTSTTYTINSIDDSTGLCEIVRPVFQGLTAKANAVAYGNFGVILVKDPMVR